MSVARIVEEYYGRIDASALDWVLELFADDAVYERAGVVYSGKERIARFFTEERLIRGRHTVEDIVSWGERAIVIGRFDGVGAAGDPRSVSFVDLWVFADDNRVRSRRTFLGTGHQLVAA